MAIPDVPLLCPALRQWQESPGWALGHPSQAILASGGIFRVPSVLSHPQLHLPLDSRASLCCDFLKFCFCFYLLFSRTTPKLHAK